MSDFARADIQRLDEFRVTLGKFSDIATTTLEEAIMDVQRTQMWLNQEQTTYWKTQIRKFTEQLQRAKQELRSKMSFDQMSDLKGQPSYVDERKAIKKAEMKLEYAEEKMKNVKRWIRLMEKESQDFRGALQGLNNVLRVDLPNSRNLLERMIQSLMDYFAASPNSQIAPNSVTAQQDFRRAIEALEDQSEEDSTESKSDKDERL